MVVLYNLCYGPITVNLGVTKSVDTTDDIELLTRLTRLPKHENLIKITQCQLEQTRVSLSLEIIDCSCFLLQFIPYVREVSHSSNESMLLWGMLAGIGNGLHYLHKHGISHGSLSLRSAVVDLETFTLKLTNYGIDNTYTDGQDDVYHYGVLMFEACWKRNDEFPTNFSTLLASNCIEWINDNNFYNVSLLIRLAYRLCHPDIRQRCSIKEVDAFWDVLFKSNYYRLVNYGVEKEKLRELLMERKEGIWSDKRDLFILMDTNAAEGVFDVSSKPPMQVDRCLPPLILPPFLDDGQLTVDQELQLALSNDPDVKLFRSALGRALGMTENQLEKITQKENDDFGPSDMVNEMLQVWCLFCDNPSCDLLNAALARCGLSVACDLVVNACRTSDASAETNSMDSS